MGALCSPLEWPGLRMFWSLWGSPQDGHQEVTEGAGWGCWGPAGHTGAEARGWATSLRATLPLQTGARGYQNHVQYYFKDFLLREQSSWKESRLEGRSQDMVTRAPVSPIIFILSICLQGRQETRSSPLQGDLEDIILCEEPENPK